MSDDKLLNYITNVLENMPNDWLRLTTHRLDIYNESLAKTEFIESFENFYENNITASSSLSELPTAYDYIRLGHPLSCVLEWTIAKLNDRKMEQVISFSSRTIPAMAILRKNLLTDKHTRIYYTGDLPIHFDADVLRKVYGYHFELKEIADAGEIEHSDDTVVYLSPQEDLFHLDLHDSIDFYVGNHDQYGSVIVVNGDQNDSFISEIQHVRRRESIAMTPANCFSALKGLTGSEVKVSGERAVNKKQVEDAIRNITESNSKAIIGSSGLSIQYAITMGLIHHAMDNHPGKEIKVIVPPNCYGGTNDQARRVAACLQNVEVMDLPVDAGHNMVDSVNQVLETIANQDAVPYIIAEIPTNPRVEVPDLNKLRDVLSKERKTATGDIAIDPVFILDQTFCPNVHFLGDNEILSSVRTISYVSGSKFPSGGLCTAGYCVANAKAADLMDKIEKHIQLCDNEATDLQMELLAKQMPSMNQRIQDAYQNTREFVKYIQETLPAAKINFVSEALAEEGFTPSVFSLDLPTKGETDEEKESYKRELNLKLINMMINEIPKESKYCVSYGQLNGCYWTIPATSTQGTTKEGDKDYIVRVALSANMDLDHHKKVFKDFVDQI